MRNLKEMQRLVCIAGQIGICLTVTLNMSAMAQPSLFSQVEPSASKKMNPSSVQNKALKRFRVATGQPDALEFESIELRLFDDQVLKAKRKARKRFDNMSSWEGTIEGDPLSSVIIYHRGNWMSGRIASGGKLFTIDVDSLGIAVIAEYDESKLERELNVYIDDK